MRTICTLTVFALLLSSSATIEPAEPGRPRARSDTVSPATASSLRLDQTQVIGTHNSYHVAPDAVADGLMRAVAPREADANAHTHRPLTEQLQRLGTRPG